MKTEEKALDRMEKAVGHAFRDRALLLRALTHSSHAYECDPEAPEDNEVLEFLGDSVVGLVAAEFALAAFPGRNEGELSKLKASATSTLALAKLAREIKLEKAIRLGRGEDRSGGRKKVSILAGSFEALTGAVYLDGGFEAARAFLRPLLGASLKGVRTETQTVNNSKSALQELCQKEGLGVPAYGLVSEKGPAHDRAFTVEVRLGGEVLAKAKGPSKKSAEQAAAGKVLKARFGRRLKKLSDEAFVIEADDFDRS